MNEYRVTAPVVKIGSGILALDKKQSSARVQSLEDLGDGLYSVQSPVQFKRGEVFGFDGDVNKSLLQQLETTGDKQPSAKELIEQISSAESADALADLVADDEKRTTVLAAVEKRLDDLDNRQGE